MMVPPVVQAVPPGAGAEPVGIPTELTVNMTQVVNGGGGAAPYRADAGSSAFVAESAGTASIPSYAPHPYAPQQFTMNTPWKLGSTDGSYAMNIAIRKQQQQEVESSVPPTAQTNNGTDARLSPLLEDPMVGNPVVTAGKTPTANNNTGGVVISGGTPTKPKSPEGFSNPEAAALLYAVQAQQSVYQDLLFRQPCGAVEAVLAAACEAMHFDIAEMWLRTGPKTHQLTNSHLRPTALEDSVRRDLVDVYYGEKSSERTHRLSPALCKRAKEASDVVWVTGHTPHGADALRASISNVRTAVAVPVCHEASNTNITIIFFSIRRYVVVAR